MTAPKDFSTPRAAVAVMVDAGAVSTIRRRNDALGMSFSYAVADGGDAQRCRDILAAVKSRPAVFFQAFRAAVQEASRAAETVGDVETSPAPLLPPEVNVRDLPIPRETFAQMAVLQFGVSIEEARAHADRVADEMEGRHGSRRRRS